MAGLASKFARGLATTGTLQLDRMPARFQIGTLPHSPVLSGLLRCLLTYQVSRFASLPDLGLVYVGGLVCGGDAVVKLVYCGRGGGA